jgi:integration host factor subunit beta
MLKPELDRRVADQSLHLHRSDVEEVVNAVLEAILTALVRRDRVELRGFGAFAVKVRAARTGRNPKTGELVSTGDSPHIFQIGSRRASSPQRRFSLKGCHCTRCMRNSSGGN